MSKLATTFRQQSTRQSRIPLPSTVFFLLVLLGICTTACAEANDGQNAAIEVGDTVVTMYRTPVKEEDETLTIVPPQTELLAEEVEGDWVGVTVQNGDGGVWGWVYAKHVRVAVEAPANAEFPIALWVIESKKPGQKPKLYYSRRQIEKVLGIHLQSDPRFIMDLRDSPPELQVVRCTENPRVTGKVVGTMGMMGLAVKVPMVMQGLLPGLHAARIVGTKRSTGETIESNWVAFEIK